MRLHYLDALRSVLMLLGVVYHAGLLYATDFDWRLPGQPESAWIGATTDALHLFRMPAFFLVAGYFACLALQRRGPSRFLGSRLLRLGVPLLTTAALVNPWLNYLSWDSWRHWSLGAFLSRPAYLADGEWIAHLWFLSDLLVLALLSCLGWRLLSWHPAARRGLAAALARLATAPLRLPLRLLGLPLVNMLSLRLGWNLPLRDAYLGGLLVPASVAEQLPYFLFGIVLRRQEPLLGLFGSMRFWLPALLLGALLAPAATAAPASLRLAEWSHHLLCWGAIALCLGGFRRLCPRPTAVGRLADAAYSVYLLHMPLVVGLGLALNATPLGATARLMLLVPAVTLLSLAAHHCLIRRSLLLSLLFNGRPPPAPLLPRPRWASGGNRPTPP